MVRMPVLCPHCHSHQVIALREPFGLTRSYTDSWGAYPRQLHAGEHQPGKRNTQPIERQPLTWRTWSKRQVRKTMGFSRSTQRHDSSSDYWSIAMRLGCRYETVKCKSAT